MKSAPFVRHVPKTVDEAIGMLAEFGPEEGRVLAGGQSLVPIMAFRLARPAHLIDINKVAELARQSSDGKILSIGAVVVTSRITRSGCVARFAAALRMPIRHPNGVWLRRRSGPRWSRRANAASASSPRMTFLKESCQRRSRRTSF